ncbi:MAG: hypothetical protein CM15mP6_3230 [Methanobacteriota archaeon]|nr:MAG: hypothetical protein CM15mP6_3230 [Euryarchaeota archaeon]
MGPLNHQGENQIDEMRKYSGMVMRPPLTWDELITEIEGHAG